MGERLLVASDDGTLDAALRFVRTGKTATDTPCAWPSVEPLDDVAEDSPEFFMLSPEAPTDAEGMDCAEDAMNWAETFAISPDAKATRQDFPTAQEENEIFCKE